MPQNGRSPGLRGIGYTEFAFTCRLQVRLTADEISYSVTLLFLTHRCRSKPLHVVFKLKPAKLLCPMPGAFMLTVQAHVMLMNSTHVYTQASVYLRCTAKQFSLTLSTGALGLHHAATARHATLLPYHPPRRPYFHTIIAASCTNPSIKLLAWFLYRAEPVQQA
jgi:hypothetical protein